MGDMGDLPANNTWKIYLCTDDIANTIGRCEQVGAHLMFPAAPVADMGIQAVMEDATGASVGLWQPGTFPGFTTLEEHGAPSWFELHARDYAAAVTFYSSVFEMKAKVISDSDEFRYTTLLASGDVEVAGIVDANATLPEHVRASWMTYWEVDDVDRSAALVQSLGGSLSAGPSDSPYGRIADVADPTGARFKLRSRIS
jgi:predicted enzyme related to lactoylglutathione lyase